MEELRYTAMLNKDLETLNRVLHDKLLYLHSSGDKHTKASYVAGLTANEFGYRQIKRSKQTITLQGSPGSGIQLLVHQLELERQARRTT